jgi:hypothetical protein
VSESWQATLLATAPFLTWTKKPPREFKRLLLAQGEGLPQQLKLPVKRWVD